MDLLPIKESLVTGTAKEQDRRPASLSFWTLRQSDELELIWDEKKCSELAIGAGDTIGGRHE